MQKSGGAIDSGAGCLFSRARERARRGLAPGITGRIVIPPARPSRVSRITGKASGRWIRIINPPGATNAAAAAIQAASAAGQRRTSHARAACGVR